MNTKLEFRSWAVRETAETFLSLERLNLSSLTRRQLRKVIDNVGYVYQVAYGAYTINRVAKLLIKVENLYYKETI